MWAPTSLCEPHLEVDGDMPLDAAAGNMQNTAARISLPCCISGRAAPNERLKQLGSPQQRAQGSLQSSSAATGWPLRPVWGGDTPDFIGGYSKRPTSVLMLNNEQTPLFQKISKWLTEMFMPCSVQASGSGTRNPAAGKREQTRKNFEFLVRQRPSNRGTVVVQQL
ncbi:hypothetical protein AJ80_08688 [Polytolypa hystricis UAMH7299]|uniref:Uncharacterized protein n=1 Tax=Polytolypa hystricis (strain UAMH7299) TaxID=1447883 RepID=A0A2B7X3L0_POLH7|nr:hypothetical protein AJ80_08688 [Polytolypa hystricis UAMH7299]